MTAPGSWEETTKAAAEVAEVAKQALARMRRAHERGTGCRLSADEINCLSTTIVGQLWDEFGNPD